MQLALRFNQRWRDRRSSGRPAGEPIDTRRYEVAAIADDATAKAFVVQHHYSRSFPAARVRFGLYESAELVGVAVFSVPCRDSVLTDPFPGLEPRAGLDLGRFVLLDRVPGNGETWFLGRCFADLRRRGFEAVVSSSDPVPRRTAAGVVVFPGHVGTIYQAHNAAYLGRGQARTLRVLPDGTVFSARAISKLRAGDRGWRYAAALLEAHGAPTPPTGDDARRDWARCWIARLTAPLRHSGTHRYAWALDRAAHVALRTSQASPYPKGIAA